MANKTSIADLRSMGRTNIVARHIWPRAFDPNRPWSVNVALDRQEARQAAQTMRQTDPVRFSGIVRDAMAYVRPAENNS